MQYYPSLNENALASPAFPEEAIESWKNSDGHRRAMVYEPHDSTALGFAVHTTAKSGSSYHSPGYAKWTLMMANTDEPQWSGDQFAQVTDDLSWCDA